MNIESKLWHVCSFNDGYAHITQKASGVIRTVQRSRLPDAHVLAMASEITFDRICREIFHGELKPRKTIA